MPRWSASRPFKFHAAFWQGTCPLGELHMLAIHTWSAPEFLGVLGGWRCLGIMLSIPLHKFIVHRRSVIESALISLTSTRPSGCRGFNRCLICMSKYSGKFRWERTVEIFHYLTSKHRAGDGDQLRFHIHSMLIYILAFIKLLRVGSSVGLAQLWAQGHNSVRNACLILLHPPWRIIFEFCLNLFLRLFWSKICLSDIVKIKNLRS